MEVDVKEFLGFLDRIFHWRRLLIKRKLFDILDIKLLSNTITHCDLAIKVKEEWRVNSSYRELVNIYRMLKLTEHLDGDIAELGVYRGGTSKLMALTCSHKAVHLFDTFEGIPYKDAKYDQMNIGECKAGIAEVKDYLREMKNVIFHPGLFPKTAMSLNCKFCFVNLDADQYQSTLDALFYFYPRMTRGGIIILHDFSSKVTTGIQQAVVEYQKHQDLICIPIWDTQALIVKH